jgi:tetratricopeptide (TPR) repeat protein
VRAFRVLAVLTLGAAAGAPAQLAVQQPTEKLLVLTLPVAPVDSAASVATMDAARARLVQLARYKALVVPKTKICEALQQSGFPCDGLMTDIQAGQLARALGINSYTTGQLERSGGQVIAKVRVISGASGFASSFTLSASTPADLGEAIAQRIFRVIRAAEYARTCIEQRSRNQLDRALAEARKAFTIEPNLAAANLCMATVFEVQHAPPDSQLAAFRRARGGDPGNSEAWSREAQVLMVKGDTLGAVNAFDSLLSYNPGDVTLRKALAQLLLQHKQYERVQRLLKVAIDMGVADEQMRGLRKRACIEGGLYRCTLEILKDEATADTTKLADTSELRLALANAQAAPDTQAMLWWARAAVKHYPTSAAWSKQLGGAFQMSGQVDSAVFYYQKALAQSPGDVATGILIAKTIVDAAAWDTAAARRLQEAKDTAGQRQMRTPFVAKIDPARQYLTPGYASPDSGLQLAAAVVGLSGGSKLAQAAAYDPAYIWLDQLLNVLTPRSRADTAGARSAIRRQASFWFGISSTLTLGGPYQQMVKTKSCDQAKTINERIQRTLQALDFGGAIAPAVAIQMRSILMQYANQMPKVKQAFKCRNF